MATKDGWRLSFIRINYHKVFVGPIILLNVNQNCDIVTAYGVIYKL